MEGYSDTETVATPEEEGLLTPSPETAPAPRLVAREALRQELLQIAGVHDMALYKKEEGTDLREAMPADFTHDKLANAAILARTMFETDELYAKAKEGFGRQLTDEEEDLFLTTIDYVLRRIITIEGERTSDDPDKRKQPYFNLVYTGLAKVLPGDQELVIGHDLVHIALALKQGVLNDNSPVPTFMHPELDANGGQQAMLEEAFASLYTNPNTKDHKSYDAQSKDPALFKEDAEMMFGLTKTPFYRNMIQGEKPYFPDQESGERAVAMLRDFVERQQPLLEGNDPLAHLALFSQGASLATGIESDAFAPLATEEKFAYLERAIAQAEANIHALCSGESPEGADEKYTKTLAITRESFARSMESAKEDPDKPVFVEILLEALKPLYAKAKAQPLLAKDRLAKEVPA